MTKWKIGLVVMGLVSAIGCGDTDSSHGEGTANGGTTTDPISGANANDGANTPDEDAGDTGSTAGATAGDSSAGGSTAGSTAGGTDAGSSTGTPGTGACTNAADMAIIDAAGADSLGCEGGVCVGKNIGASFPLKIKEPETAMCVRKEAPNLSKLSSACQACFTAISLCVPKSCVSFFNGMDACGGSPVTDFKTCDNPTAATAKCDQCIKAQCQPAFSACSGLN
jgi:hypothetical protein